MLMYLMIFAVAIAAVVLIAYVWFAATKKKLAIAKEEDTKRRQERVDNLPSIPLSEREDDAIYQWSFHHGDRLVARVVKAEVDEATKTVSFKEITHSDLLMLPDECHYQKYTLQVDTVADAIKVDKMEPAKGRIRRQVTAKISGYVEQ